MGENIKYFHTHVTYSPKTETEKNATLSLFYVVLILELESASDVTQFHQKYSSKTDQQPYLPHNSRLFTKHDYRTTKFKYFKFLLKQVSPNVSDLQSLVTGFAKVQNKQSYLPPR